MNTVRHNEERCRIAPFYEIRSFDDNDEDSVVALWTTAGLVRSWNDPHKDIARKKLIQRDLFLVATKDREVVGSAMVGYDGHRGSVYYLAVAESERGSGLGKSLMEEAESRLLLLGCPKAAVLVRTGNEAVVNFYSRLGYTQDQVSSFGKRLIPDE